ncbi:MAG: ATP-dependent helicase/nuclease subunit B [Kiritimatiellia bacterium]|jgi:ATP-dependent helicase/nuclease subunit B
MSTLVHTLRIDLSTTDAHGTGWHAEMAVGSADLGRIRVGPAGLARRLGVWLGVPTFTSSRAHRITQADRVLDALDDGRQWFSATRVTDRVGAAQWLVHAHDALRTNGWRGGPLDGSPRLRAISSLRQSGDVASLRPGLPDILHEIADALLSRTLPTPVRVTLQAPRTAYSPVVQRILAALEDAGHSTSDAPTPRATAPEHTDLGKLQRALLGEPGQTLTGDGTVRLLDGETPWEAAALGTAMSADDRTWLVTAEDALLDRVRARFDRPSLGLSESSRWRPALQILPLVLALQTSPQDPQTALELLTLPQSPVPRSVAHALLTALSEQPAVASPQWDRALSKSVDEHCAKYELDPKQLTERLAALFPKTPNAKVTSASLIEVCETIARWAGARGAKANQEAGNDGDSLLMAAASIASDLGRSLAQLPPQQTLDRLQILQYHDLAVGSGVSNGSDADAGAPPVVSAPEATPTGIARLTWFGAIAGAAEQARSIPWTPAERASFIDSGMRLPVEGQERKREQDGWLHAVLAATSELDVIAWGTQGSDTAEPHPMLDLWSSRLTEGSLQAVRVRSQDLLTASDRTDTVPIPLTDAISPHAVWTVPSGLISTTRRWSATSIESLITCPLKWTFTYAAGLRPGRSQSLPDLRMLAGRFAHSLFEEVLFEPTPKWSAVTPESASIRIIQRFNDRVETEAALLMMPQSEAFARQLRGKLGVAVANLVRQLKAGGWRPLAAEKAVSDLGGTFGGEPMSGDIDLLVQHNSGRLGIIDLKLGGATYHASSLRKGTALQLAVYAKAVVNATEPLPPVAYFILEDGELLTTDETAFPLADHHSGSNPAETYLDVERAWSWWGKTVRAGHVVGRGAHLKDDVELDHLQEIAGDQPPDNPWIDKEPNCRFCDAQRLCHFAIDGGGR